ncbi:aspartate aminotransferase family protein [Motiliproteus sp.]|uniref:aspartate aminotransferase family protein n=1 Tax=Motiliproteus sp. TaxID=1898955 RepID=UPI003BAB8763
MSQVFHRHCHTPLRTAVRGEGVYLFDQHNNAYLDACGGAAVSCLGHNHPGVRQAINTQVEQLAYAHSGFFTSEACEQLAEQLAAKAPGDLNHVYLVSGGSEAVESALKLARQYFVEIDQPQRVHFISRRQSYHGNTLGALGVGGNLWRRAPFDPILTSAEHIAACYAYRDKHAGETDYQYGQRVANELEQKLLELGPENVAAFIAEPVVGATAGAVPAVEGYFKRIREICDQYGVLLILDEVMCGIGRTGTLFAQEQEQIQADIVTVAKGLGAGYQPIGAMIASSRIYRAVADGSGFFQHGHTYMGHATASAAALAVLQAIDQDQLLERVRRQGQGLAERLNQRFENHPRVGDIRGRGLFMALELVQDRDGQQPFDPSTALAARIKQTAMDNGLMCYPMGGTIDGEQGHHVLLAPPYIIGDNQLDELVDKLSLSLNQVFHTLAKETS